MIVKIVVIVSTEEVINSCVDVKVLKGKGKRGFKM